MNVIVVVLLLLEVRRGLKQMRFKVEDCLRMESEIKYCQAERGSSGEEEGG